MAVVPTTQKTVLEAVVARLKAEVSELNGESLCYVSDYIDPPENVQTDLFAQVSPSDGQFDVDIQEGAGENDVREYAGVIVTVFSRVKLDRNGKTESLLVDATRGMLPLKRKIIRALAGRQLSSGGSDLLVNHVFAQRASAPRYDRDLRLGVMSIFFSTDFEWDLSPDEEEEDP